jgi:hypothetical protein
VILKPLPAVAPRHCFSIARHHTRDRDKPRPTKRRRRGTADDQADELAPADDQLEEIAVGDARHSTLVLLWNRLPKTMLVQTSRHEFNTWVRRTSLLSVANGVATICTPSAFFKEGFENRYTGAVCSLICHLYVPVSQVRVVITGDALTARRQQRQ